MLVLLVSVFLAAAQEALCLKLRDLVVPAVVIKGEPVWLNCSYDLEREKLYSIKWHKNNVEFYRHLPEDRPPGQQYELAGIHVDLSRSSEGNIYMSYTDVESEGIYRCEVSTEAPSFQTVKGEREMRIYVNPSVKPAIGGTKSHYGIGELVNVTCISAPSRPAAFLKWWINGNEARADQLMRAAADESADGLFTSTLVLRFKARQAHFWQGRMTLQCEAIISQAHTLRSEEIVVSNNTTRAAALNNGGDYDPLKDGPSIKGGRSKYHVGDEVDINCTASKSQPPAELHWYINDKEVRVDYLVPRAPVVHEDGAESTVLGLRFVVKQRHFQKGEMRLRCTATLSEVRRMTSEPLEAEISEQQISDLHVDLNTGRVSNKSTWRHSTLQTLWSLVVLLLFRSLQ